MKFAFMVYVARSGSTFLGQQIARRCPQVLVLPEFLLPELLLNHGDDAVRRMSRDRLRRLFRLDPQLSNLGVTDVDALVDQCLGMGIRGVLERVVETYAGGEPVGDGWVLIKKGSLMFATERITQVFPEARFIHPYRDPRGAVSSLVRARDPYGPRLPMARGDIRVASRYWSRFMWEVDSWRDSLLLLEIKYEDLCRSPDTATAAVSRFLELDTDSNASNVLVPRVAAAERTIHSLAGLDAAPSRADAWRTELSPCQMLAIEWMTTPRMERRGYDAVRLPVTRGAGRYFCLVMTWIGSSVRNVIHAGRLVWYYATNWNALGERVRRFRLLW